jgi:hypothetical protein
MTVLYSISRRWEHVLDLLICHHDILDRVLSALEVVKVEVGVAGQEHLCFVVSTCPSITPHRKPVRDLDDVSKALLERTLVPVKALTSLDTSDQPWKLGIPNIDDRVLGFRERRSCPLLALHRP